MAEQHQAIAQYLTLALDGDLSDERTIAAGTNLSAVDGGANGAYTLNVDDAPTFSGLATLDGGAAFGAGDTLTIGGDAIDEFVGTGLQLVGGDLQTTLGVSVDLTSEITGTLPIGSGGTNATSAQGAIDNISGLTTTGDLLYYDGANSTRLARGANGNCLTTAGGTLAWGSCAGSGTTFFQC